MNTISLLPLAHLESDFQFQTNGFVKFRNRKARNEDMSTRVVDVLMHLTRPPDQRIEYMLLHAMSSTLYG